ncbi:MAG: STAS domain-containing protein [Gammaproteobacteria bacterium]|nr:STAS domain-containing protein [Gammaproteobacteria bacterium]
MKKPDLQCIFESLPDLYLILDPYLKIVAVSNAYLKATMVKREDILEKAVFDIFPQNLNDTISNSLNNVKSSFERVLKNKKSDTMAVQRYDIRRPKNEGGNFEERYWSPINIPIIENDEVKYIIHRVKDVTDFIRLKKSETEKQKLTEELKTDAGKMANEIYQRAKELQEANVQLRLANETLATQQNIIQELSLPILQLRKGLLLLPIIGIINEARATQIIEKMLRSIRIKRAIVVLIDITGVAVVDSAAAILFINAVEAGRLMGAKLIITGLSTSVANTLSEINVDFSKLMTLGDLQGGIEAAESIIGADK